MKTLHIPDEGIKEFDGPEGMKLKAAFLKTLSSFKAEGEKAFSAFNAGCKLAKAGNGFELEDAELEAVESAVDANPLQLPIIFTVPMKRALKKAKEIPLDSANPPS